ncbi:MAG: S8 family serine peptidase [Bacteroidia bacterium]|nr:S8 family serine peptidase [Bacteroidia bacterium]MDW8348156.1 S8 family serine peptidase [Bacteroidia bacterium]
MERWHFTSIDLFAPTVAILAFLLFARGMVARAEGRRFLVLPELGLILLDLSLRFIFQEGNWYNKVLGMLTDNGIALVVAGTYLAIKRHHPKILFVPGIILLMMVALLYWGRQFAEYSYKKIKSWSTSNVKSSHTAQLLLELGPDDNVEELKSVFKKYNATYKKTFSMITLSQDENLAQYYTLYVDSSHVKSLMEVLKQDKENVDNVEMNITVTIEKPIPSVDALPLKKGEFVTNDPRINEQWALYDYQINAVHDLLKGIKPKKKAKVAIVDTGIDALHEDMEQVFGNSSARQDKHGHGTHCAGIAGAHTNNHKGIASLNWEGRYIEILSFAALDGTGTGTVESVAQAIVEAANAQADVISLSLGSWTIVPPKIEVDAIQYALNKGCIVVAAAGNDDEDAIEHSPANVDGVICVAALDKQGKKASFSNFNTSLKRPIAAPGVDILSLKPGGQYVQMSGTSMATPYVAGLIGILRAIEPDMSAEKSYQILDKTGIRGPDANKVGKTVSPLDALINTVQVQTNLP